MGEGGVGRVDEHVGHERGDPHGPAGAGVAQGEPEQAAELALGHGAEAEQGLRRDEVGARLLLHGQGADLRPVAVHDHHAAAVVEQGADRLGHAEGVGLLVVVRPGLAGAGERVAAQGQDDGLLHAARSSRRIDDSERFI